MKRQLLVLSMLTFVMMSCEEEIQLDVKQVQDNIVIEGLITDSLFEHEIRLSKTIGLYNNGSFPWIENATVLVSEIDLNGNVNAIPFIHSNDKKGRYYPENAFAGKIGFTYKLEVIHNGEKYEAFDLMYPVTKTDSIVPELVEEDFEPSEALIDSLETAVGPFYYMKFYAKEPPETTDYYNWKFIRNGNFQNYKGQLVYYASDEIVQENIDGIYIPGIYVKGDTVRVEMYSISRIGFLYYYDMESVINSDGGMFSPAPANPRTNLNNGALGFWQVSALDVKELIVK